MSWYEGTRSDGNRVTTNDAGLLSHASENKFKQQHFYQQ